jgi:hypothetical protein
MFFKPEFWAEEAVPEPLIEYVPEDECSIESVDTFFVYSPNQALMVTVRVEFVACE